MKNLKSILLVLFFTVYPQQISASKTQSTSSIKEAVRHFVAAKLSLNTDYKLKLNSFDSRLKLPQCTESLEVFNHYGFIKPGRNSIGVKCDHNKKWTIFTTASISIFKDVLVLTQPIRRGEIFSANNLQYEKRDISTLRSGYLTDRLILVNKQATRNLNIGIVINQSNYKEPRLIKRGEKIYIQVNGPNLSISAAGIAMMDGIKGQNIRVKNLKSKQIVQATVVQPGQVVVLF